MDNNLKRYKYYEIVWVDAQSDASWEGIDEINKWITKDFIVYDRGWLVAENEKYVVIAGQISNEGDIGNRTKIPKNWIIKKKRLAI